MALCTDDGKTTCGLHFIAELDVGTTTRHVCSNRYSTLTVCATTGILHDVGFRLVEFRVQYLVRNVAHAEHTRKEFGDFYARCTYKSRTTGIALLDNFFNNGSILFAVGLINAVVLVVTIICGTVEVLPLHVRRNFYHIKFVDVPKFTSFRTCRTCHT